MSKYRAKPCVIDGFRFDSQLEASRYQELKLMEKAGAIAELKVHPRYRLSAMRWSGEEATVGVYEADFDYLHVHSCERVIEDVKGVRTPMYRWKKKHFEIQYDHKIREITKVDIRKRWTA